jgi:hypothetical protein
MTSWAREWGLKTPVIFRAIAGVFIAISIYFAFAPISKRIGHIGADAYCIVGIGLILALCVSLRLEFNDQRVSAK